MAKTKKSFLCDLCGHVTSQWVGQCPGCGEWDVLQEVQEAAQQINSGWSGVAGDRVTALADVKQDDVVRYGSGSTELDRVLGGGLVAGSVVLIGGDPGIGKSTLLLQVMGHLGQNGTVLYTSGEESASQIALRAKRLGITSPSLSLLISSSLEEIANTAIAQQAKTIVVDSIQTTATEHITSAPGGVAQVRECTARLVRLAKQRGVTVFLVGHVTKEGSLAGPRLLEHMVDTVLYFEGQQSSPYRMLRAVKNRFGAVNELGLFAMVESGLQAVKNPSAIFLSRHGDPAAGCSVMACMEGTRPLLVEMQALAERSWAGAPRRVCIGFDSQRLAMLLAVLQRQLQVEILERDIYINVVGGLTIAETASDLAVLLSVYSSYLDQPLREGVVVFGEVGLSGEIRPVANGEDRLREAEKLGFSTAVICSLNRPKKPKFNQLQIVEVNEVAEIRSLFAKIADARQDSQAESN
ncbi:MAG TPA: DNA repair protein RadA [Gammaproteobacteria bacterium]|nr:DNA repair protein RadA [Gammaproteobacteria bacterium]